MNLQTEKIKLIEWLVGIKDLSILQKVEEVRTRSINKELPQISMEELQNRALKSEEAINKGDCTTLDELKVEVQTW